MSDPASPPSPDDFRSWALLSPSQSQSFLRRRLSDAPSPASSRARPAPASAPVAKKPSPLTALPPWALRLLAMQQRALLALRQSLHAARVDARALAAALADADAALHAAGERETGGLLTSPPRVRGLVLSPGSPAPPATGPPLGKQGEPPPHHVCPDWAGAEALSLLLDLLNWMLGEGPPFSRRAFWLEGVPRAAAMLAACGEARELDLLRRLVWHPRCCDPAAFADASESTPAVAEEGVNSPTAAADALSASTPAELRTELQRARDRLNLRLMRTHVAMTASSPASWADAADSMFAWLASLPTKLPRLPLSVCLRAVGGAGTSSGAAAEKGPVGCVQLCVPAGHRVYALNDTAGVVRLRLVSSFEEAAWPEREQLPSATPREWGYEEYAAATPAPRRLAPPELVLLPGEELCISTNDEPLSLPVYLVARFDAVAAAGPSSGLGTHAGSYESGEHAGSCGVEARVVVVPQRLDGVSQYGEECEDDVPRLAGLGDHARRAQALGLPPPLSLGSSLGSSRLASPQPRSAGGGADPLQRATPLSAERRNAGASPLRSSQRSLDTSFLEAMGSSAPGATNGANLQGWRPAKPKPAPPPQQQQTHAEQAGVGLGPWASPSEREPPPDIGSPPAPWQMERVAMRYRRAAKAWASLVVSLGAEPQVVGGSDGRVARSLDAALGDASTRDASGVAASMDTSSRDASSLATSGADRLGQAARCLSEAAREVAALDREHTRAAAQALAALERLPPKSDPVALSARLGLLEALLVDPRLGGAAASALEAHAAEWLSAVGMRVLRAPAAGRAKEVRALQAPRVATVQLALELASERGRTLKGAGEELARAADRVRDACKALRVLLRPPLGVWSRQGSFQALLQSQQASPCKDAPLTVAVAGLCSAEGVAALAGDEGHSTESGSSSASCSSEAGQGEPPVSPQGTRDQRPSEGSQRGQVEGSQGGQVDSQGGEVEGTPGFWRAEGGGLLPGECLSSCSGPVRRSERECELDELDLSIAEHRRKLAAERERLLQRRTSRGLNISSAAEEALGGQKEPRGLEPIPATPPGGGGPPRTPASGAAAPGSLVQRRGLARVSTPASTDSPLRTDAGLPVFSAHAGKVLAAVQGALRPGTCLAEPLTAAALEEAMGVD